ncbi:MAG: BatD family protein [Candidatus Methanoperedens sp.]|nr:BatD family protein [Candidatus Methanoperedens sp.]
MRLTYFLLLLPLVLPATGSAATQSFNFTVPNNTALNFENGAYIIEIIEISPPYYARVNMTYGNVSRFNNLYDGEAAITFNEIRLRAFSVADPARIYIEFPTGWGYPKISQIVRPTTPVGVPNIALTKSVDKTNINVGDIAEFKIKVENIGNATADNMTLTEQLPNGFSNAQGSRFPPTVNTELAPGSSQELYYALRAVDSGTFDFKPTIIKYGSKTSQSNPITITVSAVKQEKSNLVPAISLDKSRISIDDSIKATVTITNNGKAPAKSVLVEGSPPLGMKVVEGDLRQVYDLINPGEKIENRVTLKGTEAGNFTINLRTIYNDNPIGISTESEQISVTENEREYLYVVLPVVMIAIGAVSFAIKRHREYSF